jgi:hypothetical protein
MQEQTLRQLVRALALIHDYREQNIGLHYLVDSLEGTILSLEERMPESFYAIWDKSWSQLEIALALEQESLYQGEIQKELKNLETLLSETLLKQKDEPAD